MGETSERIGKGDGVNKEERYPHYFWIVEYHCKVS